MSFYVIDPANLKLNALLEGTTLKDTERTAKEQLEPGNYLIVEVVRTMEGAVVPERVRWNLEATRTREAKPKKEKKAKKGKELDSAEPLVN